jgi:hypothetical protein
MKTIKLIQQGDVLCRKLAKMPKGKKEVIATNRLVVAHGESGHSHVIEDDEAELIRIGERIILNLTKPATLKHEEHKAIHLNAGIWEVGRVREYDYFQHMARPVMD